MRRELLELRFVVVPEVPESVVWLTIRHALLNIDTHAHLSTLEAHHVVEGDEPRLKLVPGISALDTTDVVPHQACSAWRCILAEGSSVLVTRRAPTST